MKQIELTQGKVALVDDADFEELNQYKWHAVNFKGHFYAVGNSHQKNGKQHQNYMHRQILGLELGDKRDADHQNHNTLDNRQDNLRIATRRQNQMNQKSTPNTSSKFKGVTWNKQWKKWKVQISIGGKRLFLGYWNIEEVAALAYDMVAIREHGEFACLNF